MCDTAQYATSVEFYYSRSRRAVTFGTTTFKGLHRAVQIDPPNQFDRNPFIIARPFQGSFPSK